MKIRILLVASEFASGMIPFATTIINALRRDENFDVFALVVSSGGRSYAEHLKGMDADHLTQLEYPKSKLLKLLYKFYPIPIINAINRIDRKLKPNAVHLLTGDFSLAPYLSFSRKRKNWYYTVHDLHPHEVHSGNIANRLLHEYIVWGYRRLRNRIFNLTTSSRLQYDELKSLYPMKNIQFTHFPTLVTPGIADGKQYVSELKDIEHYILFFGTVDEYKGVDFLISAYKESETLQAFKLVIAGKGDTCRNEIVGNNNIIRINRFIEDSEIRDLFSRALYVVYPYKSATMSGVLSLAYYFKKRVLLSSVPFFLDNKTSASTYFVAGDISDLRCKMEIMVETEPGDEELNGCYEQIYSSEKLIEDYMNLYSQQ